MCGSTNGLFLMRCLDFFQLFLWRQNLISLMSCGDQRVKTKLTAFLHLLTFLFFSEWFWFKYKNTRRKTSVSSIYLKSALSMLELWNGSEEENSSSSSLITRVNTNIKRDQQLQTFLWSRRRRSTTWALFSSSLSFCFYISVGTTGLTGGWKKMLNQTLVSWKSLFFNPSLLFKAFSVIHSNEALRSYNYPMDWSWTT